MKIEDAHIDAFLRHLRLKRYSRRTLALYEEAIRDYVGLYPELSRDGVRNYEVRMMDELKLSRKTVNLHLSVLSSFSAFLVNSGALGANPLRSMHRPKNPDRLPEFYSSDSMSEYFACSAYYAGQDALDAFRDFLSAGRAGSKICLSKAKKLYHRRLGHIIIQTLFSLGVRRAELIDLKVSSLDLQRSIMHVRGKGDKMREIPVPDAVSEEILLYLQAVEELVGGDRSAEEPLLITFDGGKLYPVLVDRCVKSELSEVDSIKGRRSPHVLRHTVATELLDEGTELNSIKEFLGHSSLAATQVYTHNSIAKLKKIYQSAHPRAKKGGNYGD